MNSRAFESSVNIPNRNCLESRLGGVEQKVPKYLGIERLHLPFEDSSVFNLKGDCCDSHWGMKTFRRQTRKLFTYRFLKLFIGFARDRMEIPPNRMRAHLKGERSGDWTGGF
ncbi:hypothetical protein CEXT_85531 [Caerostris extrusa]|uniref:Uncharacterized protein n=1 Tax=Caerostris extrusa TaxID=172846 RepID=A0AAV4XH28_CAEEX|nr:hypothetical protein CEXT_85531 [Caerostris extrusa]